MKKLSHSFCKNTNEIPISVAFKKWKSGQQQQQQQQQQNWIRVKQLDCPNFVLFAESVFDNASLHKNHTLSNSLDEMRPGDFPGRKICWNCHPSPKIMLLRSINEHVFIPVIKRFYPQWYSEGLVAPLK